VCVCIYIYVYIHVVRDEDEEEPSEEDAGPETAEPRCLKNSTCWLTTFEDECCEQAGPSSSLVAAACLSHPLCYPSSSYPTSLRAIARQVATLAALVRRLEMLHSWRGCGHVSPHAGRRQTRLCLGPTCAQCVHRKRSFICELGHMHACRSHPEGRRSRVRSRGQATCPRCGS
jgi:hypothetical protein